MGEKYTVEKIGTVKNEMRGYNDPFRAEKTESEIVVDEKYAEGLLNLEKYEYIHVLYYLDKSPPPKRMAGVTYFGTYDGVFATRSPIRPSPIGMSVVRLKKVEGNVITVEGLDALDGTPVIDIKPYIPSLDADKIGKINKHMQISYPRKYIWNWIRNGDNVKLLEAAAFLHGHYCIGLAMGVMMASKAMNILGNYAASDGMEDILAITEMNHCAVDGIQFITGCTFGNNALIFRDLGKTAFSLVKRKGDICEGVRISLKPLPWERITGKDPELDELFDKVVKRREGTTADKERLKIMMHDKAVEFVQKPFDSVFDIRRVEFSAPPHAPIHDSVKCSDCGEYVMITRTVGGKEGPLCFICAGAPYYSVSGQGVEKINSEED